MDAIAIKNPSRANRIQEELDQHREALRAGQLLAIPAALLLCADEGIDPPQWLTKALAGSDESRSSSQHALPRAHPTVRCEKRMSDGARPAN
jgi:hypothetical protein